MGNTYRNNYIFLIDEKNNPHFVMYGYYASLGCAYRNNIYLKDRSYCVLDCVCTDEIETEGEYLPNTRREEWECFFRDGPSQRVAAILEAAGLADVAASKIVYLETEEVRSGIAAAEGFVGSAHGVVELDPGLVAEAVTIAQLISEDAAAQYETLEREIAALLPEIVR